MYEELKLWHVMLIYTVVKLKCQLLAMNCHCCIN